KLAKELEQLLKTNLKLNTSQLSQFENILNTLRQELTTNKNYSQQISLKLQEDYPLVLIIASDTKFTEQLTQQANSKEIKIAIATNPELARNYLDKKNNQQLPNVVIIKLTFAQSTQDPNLLFEHLSLIAQFNLLTPSIPVIVIGDSDRWQDRLYVARYGGYFYLQEPVSSTQIIDCCQQILERFHQDKKIMVIDDDIELLQTLPSLLQPWKFKLTTLNDPRQFLEVLPSIDPNLLVLDIEMPYISGIELCKILRNHPYWRKLPILFLTVHTDVTIREQVFTSGADDFINKPVAGKKLATRILNCIERRA
ncbi:MAG: response regulator, partial [Cyanobacteria bacterium J06649_11]